MKNWERISNKICQREEENRRRFREAKDGVNAIWASHKSKTDSPFIFEKDGNRYRIKENDAGIAELQFDFYDEYGRESSWLNVDWSTTIRLYAFLCEEAA